jgi:hypothetical protein
MPLLYSVLPLYKNVPQMSERTSKGNLAFASASTISNSFSNVYFELEPTNFFILSLSENFSKSNLLTSFVWRNLTNEMKSLISLSVKTSVSLKSMLSSVLYS